MTRDVQVMFTPASRDVSLGTDRFIHTRDVGLMCTLGLAEQEEQMLELTEIKRKYELQVEQSLKAIKPLRDVAILCQLDVKEKRSVALGCNLEPVKQMRDVSLRCNLDEETKPVLRDVCIGCKLEEDKPKVEQKDVCIFVNTIEPVVVVKKVYWLVLRFIKKNSSTISNHQFRVIVYQRENYQTKEFTKHINEE